MSTRHGDKTQDDRSADEQTLSRLYQTVARETPPAALDAKIIAASREALQVSRARGTSVKRWAGAISVAAVVVLTVGIALRLSQEAPVEPRGSSTITQAPQARVAPAEDGLARSRGDGETGAETNAASAPPSIEAKSAERRLQDRADSFSGANAKVESAAKPSAAPSVGALGANSQTQAEEFHANPEASKRAETTQRARTMAAAGAALTSGGRADVVSVSASGKSGDYQFSVGIRSPDRGCNQYADWWEVLSEEGALLYRRVLDHSHVDEQPFTRSGGPVRVSPTTIVWVRAHMNRLGYGGAAFKGSVATGFAPAALAESFAADLSRRPPLADACAF